ALCRAILKAGAPILLVLDDLQWCDNESLAFFLYFLHFQEESKVLIVSSMRDSDLPDKNPLNLFISTLITGNLLTEIKLNPFKENETGTLAAHIIGKDLREELVKEIYKETEGNPLYIVESLRKGLLEKLYLSKPSPPISPNTFLIGKHIIPIKVFNVFISRINQLSSPARELIELASAIGREFSLKVLTVASNFQEDKLIGALDELWHRRIIREHEANVYDFSHDKLREVAYSSMSTAKRHRMHILIARALEKLQDNIYEDINGSLAFHYDQAGLPENAILYYKKAATKAISIYATKEGVGFLNRALTLLDFIPNGKKRDELELELQVTLCLTFDSLTGYGAVNIQDICDRVQLLSHRLNFVPSVPVFRSMAIGKLAIGETLQALGIGEQILSLAKKNNDPGMLMEGKYVLGVINFWLGNFTTARSDLELAITFNEPDQQNLHTFPFTQNAQVICLSRLALTLWYLGYHYQAMQKLEEAISLSRKTAHPFSQAYSLYFGSWLAVLTRDIPLASKRNNEVLKLTEEQGFLHFLMLSKIQKGWLMAEEGNIKSGIKFLRQSLDDYGNVGMKLGRPYFCTLLAQAFEKDKAYEKAIDAIEEGISASHKTNNHFNDAELYRYKGILLWKEGAGKDEAENCLLKALKIAQQQRAKTFELKILYDLCKIWEVQGKGREAKFKLQNVYDWFSEEPLFQDLASAKTMLDTLESPENC
ncbi:MAG TPA: hypothetical protein VK957_08710, partial [Lunatimonas sp.]|nr:hypothetical protein [Lunatimonas sp.]